MRPLILKAIAICVICLTLPALTSEALAADFQGCPDWCTKLHRPGRGNLDSYWSCLAQTKKEGKCGSTNTKSTSPRKEIPTPTPRPENPPQQTQRQAPAAPSPVQCVVDYTAYYQACEHEIQQAAYECDEENNDGMNSVTNSMSAMALALGNQTSGSIQAACSKMANVSQAASAALAAYRNSCNSAINRCVSSCENYRRFTSSNYSCLSQNFPENDAIPHYSEASSVARTCQNYSGKPEHAGKALANFGATAANATQCAKLTDGRSPQQAFCDANPQVAGCSNPNVDCTNPKIAEANLVCKCTANPSDPACQRGIASGGGSLYNDTTMDQSSYRLSDQGSDFTTDVPSVPDIPMGERGPDSASSLDGSQGSNSAVSGLTGAGSGKGAQGSQDEAAKKDGSDIYGGYASGRGAGATGGFGGGGGGSGSGGYVPGKAGGGVKSPDLAKFLPKHNTMGGAVGLDGITGPHSDIWKKIRNRYQILDPTLHK
ncbi:hypothetical protein BDW_01785 [Bdellovibrio bacteriovorus W]|nr:hypothetical protein BDW_01785 [Bdellovibrio bacteriovorus W]